MIFAVKAQYRWYCAFIMAVETNISMDANTSFSQNVVWENSSGNPVDLTGYHAYMQVRSKASNDLIVALSDANGKIVVDTANSQFVIQLQPADTASAPPGIHAYDLLSVAPDGTTTKLIYGSFAIKSTLTEIP